MPGSRGIYVEIPIAGTIDDVWTKTQDPALHQRWDLRFSEIEYLPRVSPAAPQQFLYRTRIGFGLGIRGEGESTGNTTGQGGERSSALRFWSADAKSLIREGSGYWKYIPGDRSIRFLTWYDYEQRFGLFGRAVDRCFFRPLIAWATAWSFDRLRLWIEKGLSPEETLRFALVAAIARSVIAFVWIYHGLIPKVLYPNTDELRMLMAAGLSQGTAMQLRPAIGAIEVAFGLLTLGAWSRSWPLYLTILLMIAALVSVGITAPAYLSGAFNPVTLNLSVIALAVINLITQPLAPSASHCLRAPRSEG